MKNIRSFKADHLLFKEKCDYFVDILFELLNLDMSHRKLVRVEIFRKTDNYGLCSVRYKKNGDIAGINVYVRDRGVDLYHQILTLCHEMIHVEQYLSGKLINICESGKGHIPYELIYTRKRLSLLSDKGAERKTFKSFYKGKPLDPWIGVDSEFEKDAYQGEEALMSRLLKELNKRELTQEPRQLFLVA